MQFLLFLFLATLPSLATANSELIGTWSTCDQEDEHFDYEHVVEFRKNGVENELHAFRLKSDRPCNGTILTIVSRKWSYKSTRGQFRSVLKNTYAMALQEKIVQEFNKLGFCKTNAWVKDKLIDCTNDFFPDFEDRAGFRSSHIYIRKEDQLLVTPLEGHTIIYTKFNFE